MSTDHYREAILALERGDTDTAKVHAILAGNAAISQAIRDTGEALGMDIYRVTTAINKAAKA